MGDVAQILGVGATGGDDATGDQKGSDVVVAAGELPPAPTAFQPSRAAKLQGLPREVTDLLTGGKEQDVSTAELPPAVPLPPFASRQRAGAEGVKVGNKWISTGRPARKWVWAPFSSSSRTDGLLLSHWVRANVEYPDYPFARFDIHLDPVSYTDEEYRSYLQSPSWTKSETDQLLELAKRYELRWPVIYDRWMQLYHEGSSYDSKAVEGKRIEDLQYRYYSVAAALMQKHISLEAAAEAQQLAATAAASAVAVSNEPSGDDPNTKRAQDHLVIETAAARALASTEPQHQPNFQHLGSGTSNKVFDLEHERERRKQMEALWNRTKEEEEEEAALRKELKQVEAQLRKLKKSGAHILAAGTFAATGKGVGATGLVSSAASSRNPSRAATPVHPLGSSEGTSPALLDQAFVSTAPKPTPQTPYLQSGRLAPPAAGGPAGINKTLLTRMETVLQEMKIPTRPLPTKRVCDLYDSVRKDLLTLLVLQKNSLQAEGLVASKRLKLAKLDGNVRALDEETLLGISMGGSPSSQASAAARAKSGGPARSKSKTASSAAHVPKSKEAGNKGREDATAVAANKRPGGKQARKPSTKRKRKIETPTAGGTAAVAAGDAAGKGSAASSSDTKPPAKKKSKKSG